MDGTELKRYSVNPMPAKMLPNKNIMSISSFRSSDFGVSDGIDLLEFDKDGKVVFDFNKFKFTEDRGYRPKWMARAHSDFQREGNSVGYYYPEQKLWKMGRPSFLFMMPLLILGFLTRPCSMTLSWKLMKMEI